MDKLLQYYERELGTLGAHNQAFARRYPALAGALGMAGGEVGDPHLARMLQAYAMFNARTAKRLDDAFGQFSDTLLELNFPHYLRPFPACSIARIDSDSHPDTGPVVIPRGTVMHAPEQHGVACKFTTAYDVTVAPLRLADVRYQATLAAPPALRLPSDSGSAISIGIEASGTATLTALTVPSLRLFLDGEPVLCATLRDALFLRAGSACIEVTDDSGAARWQMLEHVPLRPAGFAADEALIPFQANSHPAYRLLTEYFAFPDKFNFIDLDLAFVQALLPEDCRRCTVHLLTRRQSQGWRRAAGHQGRRRLCAARVCARFRGGQAGQLSLLGQSLAPAQAGRQGFLVSRPKVCIVFHQARQGSE